MSTDKTPTKPKTAPTKPKTAKTPTTKPAPKPKKAQGFALNLEALSDRKETANVLVYGDSGTGKTTFAATAPRPILWLEAEGGTASIADKKGIDIAKVVTLADYREGLRYLQSPSGQQYETVVIDSITEAAAGILGEVMKEVAAADAGRDEFAPLFSEWGKVTGVMRAILRAYRDIDANVIFTALTRSDTDELTGRTKVGPRLTPAVASDAISFMDAVVYLAANTPKKGEVGAKGIEADEDGLTVVYNGLLKPTGKYQAKLRSPKGSEAPDFLTDPTFDQVAALLDL